MVCRGIARRFPPSHSELHVVELQDLTVCLRYINFAFDDNQETVYGGSLPRLRSLKNVYDPQRRFRQFFPL
jgi:hypothetical protein